MLSYARRGQVNQAPLLVLYTYNTLTLTYVDMNSMHHFKELIEDCMLGTNDEGSIQLTQ